MWATINGGDGFVTAQHPTDHDLVFAESQGGNMARIRMSTRQRTGLQKPASNMNRLMYEDSIITMWPDTCSAALQIKWFCLRQRLAIFFFD